MIDCKRRVSTCERYREYISTSAASGWWSVVNLLIWDGEMGQFVFKQCEFSIQGQQQRERARSFTPCGHFLTCCSYGCDCSHVTCFRTADSNIPQQKSDTHSALYTFLSTNTWLWVIRLQRFRYWHVLLPSHNADSVNSSPSPGPNSL